MPLETTRSQMDRVLGHDIDDFFLDAGHRLLAGGAVVGMSSDEPYPVNLSVLGVGNNIAERAADLFEAVPRPKRPGRRDKSAFVQEVVNWEQDVMGVRAELFTMLYLAKSGTELEAPQTTTQAFDISAVGTHPIDFSMLYLAKIAERSEPELQKELWKRIEQCRETGASPKLIAFYEELVGRNKERLSGTQRRAREQRIIDMFDDQDTSVHDVAEGLAVFDVLEVEGGQVWELDSRLVSEFAESRPMTAADTQKMLVLAQRTRDPRFLKNAFGSPALNVYSVGTKGTERERTQELHDVAETYTLYESMRESFGRGRHHSRYNDDSTVSQESDFLDQLEKLDNKLKNYKHRDQQARFKEYGATQEEYRERCKATAALTHERWKRNDNALRDLLEVDTRRGARALALASGDIAVLYDAMLDSPQQDETIIATAGLLAISNAGMLELNSVLVSKYVSAMHSTFHIDQQRFDDENAQRLYALGQLLAYDEAVTHDIGFYATYIDAMHPSVQPQAGEMLTTVIARELLQKGDDA